MTAEVSAPSRAKAPIQFSRTLVSRLLATPEAVRGTLILIAGTLTALIWANLPGSTYDAFWHLPLGFDAGSFRFELDLKHWVNDLLMATFFAHVTLEVRRELELGELRDWRKASIPVIAAITGLIIPALIYVSTTWGTAAVGGWGIVVSTDTAFVLGILALVGQAMPPSLRIFLVTLVVVDDVGALAVVAFAYTENFDPMPLLIAAAGLVMIGLMRFFGVWRGALYLLPSGVVWTGFFLSGVHATLAGVAIALLLPIFRTRAEDLRTAEDHVRAFQMSPTAGYARSAEDSLARAISVNERAHQALTPYITWLILPIFALANAGVSITADSLADAFGSRLTWGIILGLVVGKILAISLSTWIITRVRPGALGPDMRMAHIIGLSMLAGMGFTISLFVAELAFDDPTDVSRAQIGVFAATIIAAILGSITLAAIGARDRRRNPRRERLIRLLDPLHDHVLGDPASSRVAVVEYGDYATPHSPTAGEMRREMEGRFGDGVVYAFRYLASDRPHSRTVALANEAAAAQGRFWDMRDALIREAPIEDDRQIMRAAAQAGLNLRRFVRDWTIEVGAHQVDENFADSAAMHLEQAPTYFINNRRYEGSIAAAAINAAVAAARGRAAEDHGSGLENHYSPREQDQL